MNGKGRTRRMKSNKFQRRCASVGCVMKSRNHCSVRVPRYCPLDPYGPPVSKEIGNKMLKIYQESVKVTVRVGGKVLTVAFVAQCCRARRSKRTLKFEI